MGKSSQQNVDDWRRKLVRPALGLRVGGFRPTGDLTSSCFGEVRTEIDGEIWPVYKDKTLWPLCQLNLLEASFRPKLLSDIALISVFISQDYMMMENNVIEATDQRPYSGWFLRTYTTLDGLKIANKPDHASPLIPFEAQWNQSTSVDYPTHDTIPIDFEALGIGEYYEQEGIETLNQTKLGGWPSCVQSEPWWDCQSEGSEFEYVLQIDSEEKSGWIWGDSGLGYIARSRQNPNRWALDFQFY